MSAALPAPASESSTFATSPRAKRCALRLDVDLGLERAGKRIGRRVDPAHPARENARPGNASNSTTARVAGIDAYRVAIGECHLDHPAARRYAPNTSTGSPALHQLVLLGQSLQHDTVGRCLDLREPRVEPGGFQVGAGHAPGGRQVLDLLLGRDFVDPKLPRTVEIAPRLLERGARLLDGSDRPRRA